MEYLVVDTCVVLHVLRNKATGQAVTGWLTSLSSEPVLVVSSVTKGELISLKKQQGWGAARSGALDTFLADVTYVDIVHSDNALMEAYAQIDAWSKGKVPNASGSYKGGSAENMGKNDLWIAATAHVLNATLVTADNDFDHLDGKYVTLKKF